METVRSCVIDIYRAGDTIRISAYEKISAAEQTLKHYEERKFSVVEIEKLCKDVVVLLNRANKRGEMAPDALNDLKKVGHTLYDELLTPKAKELLRSTSSDYLVLYMDDQLVQVPWELLYDGEHFLCLRFNVGRIVSTKQSVTANERRKINNPPSMLIVADPQGNLEAAYREGISIRDEFSNLDGVLNVNLASSKVETSYIKKNIRDFDIVHYAGHADYNSAEPSESGWFMYDGRWTADDIIKMTGNSMPALVFSNACHSGRTQEWKIRDEFETDVFGLANAFLLCGVTHYIGTFWEVLDSPSSMFAIAFYKELINKMSVGQALRNARNKAIENVGMSNVIWASYMLYGDPTSKLFSEPVKDEGVENKMTQDKGEKHSEAPATEDKPRSMAPAQPNQRKIFLKGLFGGILALCVLAAIIFISKGNFIAPQTQKAPSDKGPVGSQEQMLELSMNIIGQREEADGSVSEVLIKEGSILRSNDNFQVHFQTNKDAYVYVLIYDSANEAHQLFPEPKIALNNNIKGAAAYSVPTAGQWFWLDETIGTETIFVLASETPLNNIQALLGDMGKVTEKDKKALSQKIKNEIVSIERGVGGITEGKAQSFKLKNGKSIESVTDIVKGAGAVARAVSFKHIDRVTAKDNRKFKDAVKNIAKGKAVAKSGNALIRSSQSIILNAVNPKKASGLDEKAIAKKLSSIQRNMVLEENRGVGGVKVYKEAGPSVVLIVTNEGIGSGSVIDKQGHIITNWHVINGYDKVVVLFKPVKGIEIKKENAYVAKVLKVDETTDLALLKLEKLPLKMPVMKIGSMNNVQVAQEVHAIGHPEGEIWTYTKGIISQIRPLYEWSYDDKSKHQSKVIQTQTPINPGNSGGPLLNDNAELIGVNSFTKRGEGLNFAVSVDVIKRFIDSKGGSVAASPKQATKDTAAQDWSKNAKYYEYDTNKDGVTDVIGVDTDGNGKIDMYIVDLNQDGVPDYIGFDKNENGVIETKAYDTNKNGILDTWAFDTDEDGKIDLYGIDNDEDGTIDEYVKE